MNKKILMLTIMLLAMLTLAMVPVQAGPKTKLDFTLYIEGAVIGWGEGTVAGPKKSAGEDYPIQKTFHAKATDFAISLAIITIGDETYHFDAMPEWNITGEWDFLCDDFYTHRYTITQTGGTFTGEGTYPAEGTVVYYELIYGTINSVTGQVIMHGEYYSDADHTSPIVYTFTAAITIDPFDGSMDGILTSQNDLSFVSTSGAAVDVEDDFDITKEHSFNFNWNTLIGTSKAEDTITFYDGMEVRGTLEISVRDKVNYGTEPPPPTSEGIFFGKGTGALKGVKIEGTASGTHIPINYPDDPLPVLCYLTREGTITGWPTD